MQSIHFSTYMVYIISMINKEKETMKAKVQIAAVFIDCPKCETEITDRDGSLLHTLAVTELTVTCQCCGEELEMPKWVWTHA